MGWNKVASNEITTGQILIGSKKGKHFDGVCKVDTSKKK